jgi:hypothetical protein
VEALDRIFDLTEFPRDWAKTFVEEFPRPENAPVGPIPKPNAFIPIAKSGDVHVPADKDYFAIITHLLTAMYAIANFLAQEIPTDHPNYVKLVQEQSLAQIGMTGVGLAVQQLMLFRKSESNLG